MAHESSILPNINSVLTAADSKKREEFHMIKQENPDFYDAMDVVKEEVMEMDMSTTESNSVAEEKPLNRAERVTKLITKHFEFIETCKNVPTSRFLLAVTQLCHMDSNLAEQVWLQNFPKFWSILDEQQRAVCIQTKQLFW